MAAHETRIITKFLREVEQRQRRRLLLRVLRDDVAGEVEVRGREGH
jgi:hypothetical protein